jgi:hypothetical protein
VLPKQIVVSFVKGKNFMRKTMRWNWIAGLAVVLTLLISACAADTEALQQEAATPKPTEDQIQGSEPEVDAVIDQPIETESSLAVGEPMDTPEATDAGIPEPELGFEHGYPNLKATAPSTFMRAAGKPQMVELFAFW